jgi:CubicO group peptidase (beta-lactamase class C family)
MMVDDGLLSLDEPLPVDWRPQLAVPKNEVRATVSLRHALQMASGLMPVDAEGLEYQSGSGLAYWAGDSAAIGARRRGLVRTPGTFWEYENYDTLLAVHAMRRAIADDQKYHQFPSDRLLTQLGMHQTLLGVDRFGDFILSSQVYSSARDLARFGLLYLNAGVWRGERLVSQDWIDFVRTPAPAGNNPKGQYGGHWWLVPSDRTDVPSDAYAAAGSRGQFVIVVPSHDVVIVRRGLDYGRFGFDQWDLTREVLRAIPPN